MDDKHNAFDVEEGTTLPCIRELRGDDSEEPPEWRISWSDTGVTRETSMAWAVLKARDDENAEVEQLV